jgi:hypothetical protein
LALSSSSRERASTDSVPTLEVPFQAAGIQGDWGCGATGATAATSRAKVYKAAKKPVVQPAHFIHRISRADDDRESAGHAPHGVPFVVGTPGDEPGWVLPGIGVSTNLPTFNFPTEVNTYGPLGSDTYRYQVGVTVTSMSSSPLTVIGAYSDSSLTVGGETLTLGKDGTIGIGTKATVLESSSGTDYSRVSFPGLPWRPGDYTIQVGTSHASTVSLPGSATTFKIQTTSVMTWEHQNNTPQIMAGVAAGAFVVAVGWEAAPALIPFAGGAVGAGP